MKSPQLGETTTPMTTNDDLLKPGDKIVDLRDKWEGIIESNPAEREKSTLVGVTWTRVKGREASTSGHVAIRDYLCVSHLGHIGTPCVLCGFKRP